MELSKTGLRDARKCWVLRQGFRMGNEECEVMNDEILRKWLTRCMEMLLVSGEDSGVAAPLGVALDLFDGVQDIEKALAILPHRAIASFNTRFLTGGRNPRSDATSTGRFSRCSSSRMRAAWSSRLRPSSSSTKKSTSLPRRASPRETEPNRRTFRAPWRAAI